MCRRAVVLVSLAILINWQSVIAQTTAFNYQGRLTDGGNPANGPFQMQFKLFDALAGGNQIGATLTDVAITAANGVFGVKLDFGSNALNGANRWLEIAVRRNSGESYTILSPREQIASSPYAVRTLSAAMADTAASATTAATATNALNLGGVAANQFVQTSDSRLSDARAPQPGSASYVQNGVAQQASTNFNISGNGIVGGRLGVGTSSPTVKLHVISPDPTTAIQGQITGGTAIAGFNGGSGVGVYGQSDGGDGVAGLSTSGFGVRATSQTGFALYASSTSGTAGFFGGRVGIDSTNPRTKLSIWNQTFTIPWTTDGWSANLDFPNASALGWNVNNAFTRFGLGQTNTGLQIFHTLGDFGTTMNPAVYDLTITNSGFVGIGMGNLATPPQRLLHVNGRARVGSIPLEASAAQVCFNGNGDLLQCGASSLKLKTDVQPFRSGLNVLRQLNPISYRWRENGDLDFGLGAEDVAGIAPELIILDQDGHPAGVRYERLNILLINAIKQQQRQIDRQQRQIDMLRKLACRRSSRARECKEGLR